MSINVTLNPPTLIYSINRYYQRALQRLVDSHIYDISNVAIGTKSPVMGTSGFTAVAAVTTNATLPPGTYTYAIAPVFENGSEGLMTEITVVVGAPTNSVNLAWTVTPGAVSYNLYRTTSSSWVSSFLANVNVSFLLDVGFFTSPGFPQASQVVLAGTVTPANSYLVQLNLINYLGNVATVAQKTSNPDGTFSFSISVPRGTNGYQAVVSGVNSEIVFVNAYNVHLLFETICQELLNFTQEMFNQVRANRYIQPTADLCTGLFREPTATALQEAWGALTDLFQFQGYTPAQFANAIVEILAAYKTATTYQSILDLFENFQNTFDPLKIVFFGQSGGVGSMGFPIGTDFKFYVLTAHSQPSLAYSFNGGNLWFQEQRGYVNSGDFTLPSPAGSAGTAYFAAYIDGTRDTNGYFNLKILQATFGTLPGDISDPVFAGLPINSKVLGVFVVDIASQGIINIAGQGRLGAPGSPFTGVGTGPYWCGPSFITGSARIQSAKYKASRALIYFQDVLGAFPMAGFYEDSQYQEKLAMLINVIKAIKSQGTVWFFGAAGRPSQKYLEDGNGNLQLDGSGNPYLPFPFLTEYQEI